MYGFSRSMSRCSVTCVYCNTHTLAVHVNIADLSTTEFKQQLINFVLVLSHSCHVVVSLFPQLMDTTVINIHVPNHSRRKKATVIRHGIQKLFDFLLLTMSKAALRWRLVIGRFGRLGHSELEGTLTVRL